MSRPGRALAGGLPGGRTARLAPLLLAVAAACAHAPPPSRAGATPATPAGPEVGLATFYSDRLQGRRTASGAPYDRAAFTCAHRSQPFGAVLRVTDVETGRRVEVTVNDRGPWAEGRVVDLSRAAAEALGMVARGVIRVEVVRVR